MTTDDILRMAREAGIANVYMTPGFTEVFERFAALVAAAEREKCAKVCMQSDKDGEGPDCWDWHAKDYAYAIRARGTK